MVPEGWKNRKLSELYEFKNGFNADASQYGEGTKFVNVMDIFRNDTLTSDLVRGEVAVPLKSIEAYALRYGDVLFNRTSEVPKEIAFASVYLDHDPIIFGGFVIRGRPISHSIHAPFARYCFKAPSVRSEKVRRAQGGIRANIGQQDLGKVELLVPPLPEQKKIAEILGTWDRAIEVAEKQLKNAEAQKRALMQHLLTGTHRLKGFEGSEWKTVKLGDVLVSMEAGVSVNSQDTPTKCNEIGVLKTSCVSSGKFQSSHNKVVSDQKEVVRVRVPVKADTIVMSRMNTPALVGANGYVDKDHDNLYLPDRLWALTIAPNKTLCRWVAFWLSSPPTRYMLSAIATGTSGSMKNITKEDVRSIKLELPSLDEQTAMTEVLEAAEQEVNHLSLQVGHLRTEKRALMQQLLTGKKRVKVEEAA